MSQKPLSILISGAGIGGSTLALSLARNTSFTPKPLVTLIERAATPRTTGQAIDIRGPGVNVIRKLGLEEKIRQMHTTEVGIAFVNPKGSTIARFDSTGDADRQSVTTSEYEILRGDLAELLMDDVDDAREREAGTNVNVVYGESIKSLKEQQDGVAVDFSNAKLKAQTFDVVVAADGMASRTRSMMFEQHKSMASSECVKPLGWYIAYFTVPREQHDEDLWKWYNAPGGLCVHMRPHRNKTTMGVYLSIVYSKKERVPEVDGVLAKGIGEQKIMLRDRFKNVGWQIERLLSAMDRADDFYMQQVALVVTPQWTTGRCALVGDSAHALMGMGTSFAMIGAYIMAGELAKVKSSDAKEVVAALHRYEGLLRPLVEKHQSGMPPGFPQLANPQTALGVGVFHTAVKLAYWTKLDKLLAGWGGSAEDVWKLPDYEGIKTTTG